MPLMIPNDDQTRPAEYDSPWKEILRSCFREFLAFFLPEAHDGIDWQREPAFLDKELNRITRKARAGNRRVDLLVKAWLREGGELWVLIHVEVQGNRDPDFQKRMFICHYRAFDLQEKPVVSLAILADEETGWRPAGFGYQMWGTRVEYRFQAVKLLDYTPATLEGSDNPFAIVTLVHLTGKRTGNQPEERLHQKKRITHMLYERGFDRQRILDLFRFIDWVLDLPDALDDLFWQDLSNFEETLNMQYVTSVERIGMRKGEEIGRQQGRMEGRMEGKAEMLLKLLQARFGLLPDPVRQTVANANPADIDTWADKLFQADSLQAVFQ
ncbi:MAG: cytosolic protein [Magnetococcales bacterium]|nr:cytosolic protein [Magnetococcales bacterium]